MLSDFPLNYTVIDLETTGLSPSSCEIIELSALKVVNGKVAAEFNRLVRPRNEISYFITNLTGISNDMVKNEPYIENLIDDYCDFIGDDIVIGHNVMFDIGFIRYQRENFNNKFLDTCNISRALMTHLPNHKLHTIAAHFGFDTVGMHRGLQDCIVTDKCYNEFRKIAALKNQASAK